MKAHLQAVCFLLSGQLVRLIAGVNGVRKGMNRAMPALPALHEDGMQLIDIWRSLSLFENVRRCLSTRAQP